MARSLSPGSQGTSGSPLPPPPPPTTKYCLHPCIGYFKVMGGGGGVVVEHYKNCSSGKIRYVIKKYKLKKS